MCLHSLSGSESSISLLAMNSTQTISISLRISSWSSLQHHHCPFIVQFQHRPSINHPQTQYQIYKAHYVSQKESITQNIMHKNLSKTYLNLHPQLNKAVWGGQIFVIQSFSIHTNNSAQFSFSENLKRKKPTFSL
mgnify:CR=1 FL=1